MRMWMVVNRYLRAEKYKQLDRYLQQAAVNEQLEVQVFYNSELPVCYGMEAADYFSHFRLERPDFVLFWDKDIRLASWLEQLGLFVFNSSASIAACDDKSETHARLSHAGIRMPKTIMAPFTYANIGYTDYEFLNLAAQEIEFPMVVKECFGSFGAQVYLVPSMQELKQKVEEIGPKPFLFQEFIKASVGRDIRLQVVGTEVVASMYRYSENGDFRANISNGGSMKSYEPNAEEAGLAIKCIKELGLSFGGVDFLFDGLGGWLVCEVNSNAHFKNIAECTGVDVAGKMLHFMKEKCSKG